jgi:hypothetical protein
MNELRFGSRVKSGRIAKINDNIQKIARSKELSVLARNNRNDE